MQGFNIELATESVHCIHCLNGKWCSGTEDRSGTLRLLSVIISIRYIEMMLVVVEHR